MFCYIFPRFLSASVTFFRTFSLCFVILFSRSDQNFLSFKCKTIMSDLFFFESTCKKCLYQNLLSFLDIDTFFNSHYIKIIYVFLTIFLYLLKCPQSLILSALRAFCFCGKPHISRSIFLYFRYQAWLKSW